MEEREHTQKVRDDGVGLFHHIKFEEVVGITWISH